MFNKIKTYSLLNIVLMGLIALSNDASAQTLGDMFIRIKSQTNLILLIPFLSYISGAFLVAMGLYKAQKHMEFGPQNVPVSDPFKYLLSGGILLAFPSVHEVVKASFGDAGAGQDIDNVAYWNDGDPETTGLSGMLIHAMENVYVPMQWLLIFFCYLAGAILMMIAVHRFTKTAQEGPRGPTGMGTIATFVLAGCLFSLAPSIGMFTETLFGGRTSYTTPDFMSLIDDADALSHAEDVATAILTFLIIVGILSIIRGMFVLRGVAEGNQQMTMMSGVSHVIAGAILVNFGQFANIIQKTLGIDGFGVLFGT